MLIKVFFRDEDPDPTCNNGNIKYKYANPKENAHKFITG